MTSWIANVFICAGLWGVGSKRRGAFLFSILGEALYIFRSYQRADWALYVVCWVFLLMAVRGYSLWGRNG